MCLLNTRTLSSTIIICSFLAGSLTHPPTGLDGSRRVEHLVAAQPRAAVFPSRGQKTLVPAWW